MKKQVYNPYLPGWEYVPDGEPHVFGDRLYIFGSHDQAGGDDYCVNDYIAWSTPINDLSDWKYEGVIYRKSQHPYKIGRNIFFAPDVARGPAGRYYLFYSVADSCIISVAVCDTPAGEYQYFGDVKLPSGHVLGTAKEDWYQFDPAILVDEDQRIWLYSGSGQKESEKLGHPVVGCFVIELEQDMLTVKGEPKIILPANETWKEPNFFEGASIRHIGDLYYLVYPATDASGLNYATSRYPDRDFIYRGRIHSTSDIGYQGRNYLQAVYPPGNNHGGLVCVNNQWYIFDHRMTNGTLFNRQGVAEPITIEADGRIEMVEATSCGLNGGPLEGYGEYPAYIACNLVAGKILGIPNLKKMPMITQCEEDYNLDDVGRKPPVPYVTGIRNECRVGYKYFEFEKTITEIKVTIRGRANGIFVVQTDEKENVASEIPVKIDTSEWIVAKNMISIPAGKSAVFFTFHGKGELEFLSFEFM